MDNEFNDILSMAASSANIVQQEYTPNYQPQRETTQYQQQQNKPDYLQYKQQQQPQQPQQPQDQNKLLMTILQEVRSLNANVSGLELAFQKEIFTLQSSMIKMERALQQRDEKECVLKFTAEKMVIPVELRTDKQSDKTSEINATTILGEKRSHGGHSKNLSFETHTKKSKK